MTQEEHLFDLIGQLPDAMLEEAAQPAPKSRRRWLPALAAACLALAVGAGLFAFRPSAGPDTLAGPDSLPSQQGGQTPTAPVITWAVPPQTGGGDSYTDLALHFTLLPMGERAAEYHEIYPGELPQDQRPRFVGESYGDLEGWYLPADSIGLQYLLHQEEAGTYTLWAFSHFIVWDEEEKAQVLESIEQGESLWNEIPWFSPELDFSPYPYRDVLETIYGVFDAAGLASVTVSPANMDNTDAGKALQAEIGTHTLTDKDALETLYNALASMTCLGSNHWDLIDRGDSDADVEGISGGLLNAVRLGRYLTLKTSAGAVIDSLKYTAAGGQFYEYGGIAYTPLDAETAAAVTSLLGIEP